MGRVLLADLSLEALESWLVDAHLIAMTARTVVDPQVLRDDLDRVREQGWAVNDQELAVGLRSVAAPIRDAAGVVVATVNISATASADPSADYLEQLLVAADRITADLVATGRSST